MASAKKWLPADETYVLALGCAVLDFMRLEWSVIWLFETLDENFLKRSKKMTSGEISKKFSNLIDTKTFEHPDLSELKRISNDFSSIVKSRDSLIHAKPFTDKLGEQSLLYNGRHGRKYWPQDEIENFSAEVRILSSAISRIFCGKDGTYQQYQKRKGDK